MLRLKYPFWQEAKNQKYPIFHCLSMLKHFDWAHLMLGLRIFEIRWFGNTDGFHIYLLGFFVLVFLVTSTLTVLSPDEIKGNSGVISHSSPGLFQLSSNRTGGLTYGRTFLDSSYPSPTCQGTSKSDILTSDANQASENHLILVGNFKQTVSCHVKDLLKDCVHLSLRCLKTIFNNQHGCKRAFEHSQAITVVTFSLLHPNFG
ncbi:uncharacterized protein DEA37_0011903 [Paragonimus westermani]|uniref:Uncharacterized protein n=1 Tax=Paragonimus westermani TaxID=34504 RepID=A0A5J4P0L6_9TREM|nr:uncharacterized protein DEA37_0011903 [Paragonimus westermani]